MESVQVEMKIPITNSSKKRPHSAYSAQSERPSMKKESQSDKSTGVEPTPQLPIISNPNICKLEKTSLTENKYQNKCTDENPCDCDQDSDQEIEDDIELMR